MICGSTCRRHPGFGSLSANPGRASRGFRQSHDEAAQARSIAEPAAPPAGRRRSIHASHWPRSRPLTSPKRRVFVERELRGFAADDDLTTRLAATLRTYLEEHSSRGRTAKRLGIHENTVSYRIEQAEEILGRSVDQRTLELRVALALAHLVGGL